MSNLLVGKFGQVKRKLPLPQAKVGTKELKNVTWAEESHFLWQHFKGGERIQC